MKARNLTRIGTTVLVAALALAACKNDDAPQPAAQPQAGASPWPEVKWPLPEDPALEKRVNDLLATMTVEEKVGQIVQGDISSLTPEDVRTYHLGSVLAGGNSDPGGRYNASPAEWLALADAFYEASIDTSKGGKGIPVIFGIDAVHGQSNVLGATVFPHNIGLGATRNPELLRRIGEITALETRATGMEWAFAPTVAVPQDDRWGRSYEGYSESPEVVGSFAGAMVEGLQGKVGSKEFLDGRHVISSVKHFLGDGGTTNGEDQGDTKLSEADLVRIHAAGYPPAIAAGAQSVMASFNSVNGVKMHGNKAFLTDALKGRMGFGGFVVGDWNGHGQVDGCTNSDCPATINAGLDMAMAPDSWKGFYDTALAAAKAGTIPKERLDDAVRRILRVKFRLGLFEAGKPSQRAVGGKFELLGAPEHRAVARQAVRESLVLLKNQAGVLPLDPRKRILVAGNGANEMTTQVGGWTFSWQGTGSKRADFPNADTIFEGIAQQAKAAGGEATLSVDGTFTRKPDVAVVVFGEDPYAEFQGDIPNLMYRPGDDSDLELIKRLKAAGVPVVSVFLSGRPLWVNREINASDAFVAAWLPGSEGAGVADVLLRKADGSVQNDFKGKLSFSWPRNAMQVANNVGQKDYNPQFAFGFGLTYADDGNLAALPEESGVKPGQTEAGTFYARGTLADGLRLRLGNAAGQSADVATLPATLPDGSLTVTAVDHEAQEDARRLAWSGAQPATATLATDKPTTLMRETNGEVMIVLTTRVEEAPTGDVSVGVTCGSGCKAATLPARDALAKLPKGQWTTFGIPLKCLAVAGADMRKLDAVLVLQSAGKLQLSVSRVALGASNEAEHVLPCKVM